jgi:hypothetical protein
MEEVNEIVGTDLPEIDRLVQAFTQITGTILEHGRGEIDVLRALGDQEELVKVQVKLSTVEHCRSILQQCYQLIAARRDADVQAEL